MIQKTKYLALALALTGALSGCGGGGGGASLDTFDEFYGSWKSISKVCGRTQTVWSNGSYFTNGSDEVTLNATDFESKGIHFSDNKCATKAGAVIRSSIAQWSAGSASGRSNVARLALTSTGFTANKDGEGTGITVSAVPATGEVQKYLIDVVDGKLCVGSDPKTADSDGYPTVIDSTDCWSR